ncbi:MBL fold metallo-hydrolase [Curtobacterium flaccumfaciens pv. flaccumfaciens]|uniref:MBL fold metallo-hydrolase n=2 Tax=Curtobacterium flaccumfaciens TaxID=2035 RepID=UPI003AB50E58
MPWKARDPMPTIRRAHAGAAARFRAAPHDVWQRFEAFDNLPFGSDTVERTVLRSGKSSYLRTYEQDLGVVEELLNKSPGLLRYRARRPGGSAAQDVDVAVRVSQDDDGSLVTWSAEFVAASGDARRRERLESHFAKRLEAAGGVPLAPLRIDVAIGAYTPITRTDLSGSQATWSSTTATLISGERDAILVDALMTSAEADSLIEWVRGTKRRLTTVIVTQGQADHFYGLSSVLQAFPDAVALATPGVAEQARRQAAPEFVNRWRTLFPSQLPNTPTAPIGVGPAAMSLEGHTIQLFDVGTIAGRPTSVVSVRDLDTVISGDLLYNGVHPWLVNTKPRERASWSKAMDIIEALRSSWAIAGHRDPLAVTDAAPLQIAFVRNYLEFFEHAAAESVSAQALVASMQRRFPELGNAATLHASAVAQFIGDDHALVEADFPDLLPPAIDPLGKDAEPS